MRVLLVLAALLALVAGACGSETDDEAAPTVTPQSETLTATMPEEGSRRPPAPPIAGESLEGETIALADFRGRAVLVNVWSSW